MLILVKNITLSNVNITNNNEVDSFYFIKPGVDFGLYSCKKQ